MVRTRHITRENFNVAQLCFREADGLIPVVTQERESKAVLMLAYANRNAVQRTLESGYAHYYSRSRATIWKKGETSGNVQRVHAVLVDCDGDALLYIVDQQGDGACHTGQYSCFYRRLN